MIQSVNRALDILEFLVADPACPKTPGEIAKKTGLNPATASNIIKTMVDRNYIEQAGPRKGYVPGVMCFCLSKEEFYYSRLNKAAASFMEKLAKETGETVLLAVLKAGKRYILHQVSGGGVFHVRRDIVLDPRVTDTATGLVLLSELIESDLKAFAQARGLDGDNLVSLRRLLKKVRDDGFCILETHEKQVAGIAYPVCEDGKTAAALGLFLPVFRFRGAHRKKILRGLESAVNNISGSLTEQG